MKSILTISWPACLRRLKDNIYVPKSYPDPMGGSSSSIIRRIGAFELLTLLFLVFYDGPDRLCLLHGGGTGATRIKLVNMMAGFGFPRFTAQRKHGQRSQHTMHILSSKDHLLYGLLKSYILRVVGIFGWSLVRFWGKMREPRRLMMERILMDQGRLESYCNIYM